MIEPYLSWQWFVKMAPLAAPAIEAAKRGKVKFYPSRYKNVYLHWLENIRDWCISRQLWWGHRIPVWYRGDEMVVSVDAPAGEGWRQDEDVLDTWFSSWLWPFATLGWPDDTADLAALLPEQPHGHRRRHHLLLGRAHDHGRVRVPRRGAVPARAVHRHRARRAGPQDDASRSATRPTRSR